MKRALVMLAILLVVPLAALGDGVDFTAMRLNYASQPDYNPYLGQAVEMALIKDAMKSWHEGDAATTVKKLEEVLKTNPVSIDAHRRLADVFRALAGQTADEQRKKELQRLEDIHRKIFDGLVKSITDSGDGENPKTAYKVISISEEYVVLLHIGLQPQKQQLEENEFGPFDVLTVKKQDGSLKKVYFDISILKKAALSNMAKKAQKTGPEAGDSPPAEK